MVQAVRGGEILGSLKMAGEKIFILVAPVAAIALLISIGSTVVQVGFLQVEEAFALNLEKINPLAGLKRMFSLKSVVEAAKSFLKLVFIAAIVVLILKKEIFKVQIQKLALFRSMMSQLEAEESVDEDTFKEQISRRLPYENADKIIDTMVDWGRYAELFDFDATLKKFTTGHEEEENQAEDDETHLEE